MDSTVRHLGVEAEDALAMSAVMFDRELTTTNTTQTQVVLTICNGTIIHEISA